MFKTMKGELNSKIKDDAINALDQRYYITRKLYHVICNMLYGAVHRSLRAQIRQYCD